MPTMPKIKTGRRKKSSSGSKSSSSITVLKLPSCGNINGGSGDYRYSGECSAVSSPINACTNPCDLEYPPRPDPMPNSSSSAADNNKSSSSRGRQKRNISINTNINDDTTTSSSYLKNVSNNTNTPLQNLSAQLGSAAQQLSNPFPGMSPTGSRISKKSSTDDITSSSSSNSNTGVVVSSTQSSGFSAFDFFANTPNRSEDPSSMKNRTISDREPATTPTSLATPSSSRTFVLSNLSALFSPSRSRALSNLIEEKKWNQLKAELVHTQIPPDLDPYSESTILLQACEHDAPADVISTILQTQDPLTSTPDSRGNYPLHIYCQFGTCQQTFTTLLHSHPPAASTRNKHGEFPLQLLLERGVPSSWIISLLQHSPRTATFANASGSLPLHYAAKHDGRIPNFDARSVLRALIDAYPKAVGVRNEYGATPLFRAVSAGVEYEALEVLVGSRPGGMVLVRNEFGTCCVTLLWDLSVAGGGGGGEKASDANGTGHFSGGVTPKETTNPGNNDRWFKKMELLIKAAYHDTIDDPLPDGKVWRLVHATAAISCPPDLLKYTINLYRDQIRIADEHGRLPLHLAAAAPFCSRHLFKKESKTAVEILVEIYPRASRRFDIYGRIPLHYALESGKTLEQGVERLLETDPASATIKDISTGLYPFMLAAINNDTSKTIDDQQEFYKQMARYHSFRNGRNVFPTDAIDAAAKKLETTQRISQLETLYKVIRSAPHLLSHGIKTRADDDEIRELRAKNTEMREKNLYLNKILRGVCLQLDALDAKHEQRKTELELEIARLRQKLKILDGSDPFSEKRLKKFGSAVDVREEGPHQMMQQAPLKSMLLKKERKDRVKADPRRKYRRSKVSFKSGVKD